MPSRRQFIEAIFPREIEGYIEIRHILVEGGGATSDWLTQPSYLSGACQQDGHNLYFGPVSRAHQDGKRASTRFVYSLWADFDLYPEKSDGVEQMSPS